MFTAPQTLVNKLVVLATVIGLGSALAFLLVACGTLLLPGAERLAGLMRRREP